MTAPVSTHKTSHSTRAESKSDVRPLPSAEPTSTIEPSFGQAVSPSLDRYEGASHAADRQSVVRAVVADMDGVCVFDADCERAVAQLSTLSASDVKGAWEALPAKTRETLLKEVDGEARAQLVDTLTRGGVVKPEVLPQPTGWGDVPKAPRLVVNERAFDPAMRAMLHDENCARASSYQDAHGDYCARYIADVLDKGDPVEVGARIRSQPIAQCVLPAHEPGTAKDDPFSSMKGDWRALRSPDHDALVFAEEDKRVAAAYAVQKEVLVFEARGEVEVAPNVKLSANREYDALLRPKSAGVAAEARVAGIDVEASATEDLRDGANGEVEFNGSIGTKGVSVDAANGEVTQKFDLDCVEFERNVATGEIVAGRVNIGSVFVAVDADRWTVGLQQEAGNAKVEGMLHFKFDGTGLESIGQESIGHREVPEKALKRFAWAELSASQRAALEQKGWGEGEWSRLRQKVMDRDHAQGMVHVFRR